MKGCRGVLLGLVWAAWGCSNLPTIEANVCGNAVRDEGEDCDTVVEEAGAKCRPQGVEGECHFDCTTGGDGTRPTCPDGMGCASDGLCRAPTGDFEPKQPLAPQTSSWLSVADFDGDKRSEIISTEPEDELGLARFRLHYFDNEAKLVETRTFPRFASRPIAREVTGDAFDDLLFSNGNIGVMPGRADREWVPAAFSSYVVPSSLRVVRIRDDAVRGILPIATFTTIDGVSGLFVQDSMTGRLEPRAELPRPVDELAGELLAVDLFSGPDSPCSELVIAFRGDDRLRVFDLCETVGNIALTDADWRERFLEHVIELPVDLPIEGGPLSGDVDGDGHLDLVFESRSAPYVLYGDGARILPEVTPLELQALLPGMTEPVTLTPPMPLALGDVSGDGVADYVLSQQVLASLPTSDDSGTVYVLSTENRAAPWTLARIADLNGNGFPDVVVGTAGQTGFTFHNGAGGPYLIGVRVATERPLRFFTTGDFDGDLNHDLAILEQGGASQDKDTLAIAFGAANSLPLPATRVTEVEGVEQLGDCSIGGMDTLFLVTTRKASGQSTFTLFDGSPDRLPFASYALVTFSVDSQIQEIIAASLVLGAFSDPGAKDLVAVGSDMVNPGWTQWLLPDIGGMVELPRLLEGTPSADFSPLRYNGTQGALSVAGAAADLDRDGLDEVLWLMPGVETGCALLVYGVDARSGRAIERQVVQFDSSCFEPGLGAADLDRDGAVDVMVVVGNIAVDEQSRLEVLWNDGEGRFSAAESSKLAPDQGHPLRAFTVLGESPALAFVTDSGLYRSVLDTQTRSFAEAEKLGNLDDGRSVVLTDPNGDGLSDIVASDAAGLWLLRAQLR